MSGLLKLFPRLGMMDRGFDAAWFRGDILNMVAVTSSKPS